jgi:hypothetical protein
MSIGLKSDSSGTSGSIVINGSDAVLVTPTGITTASIQNSSITTAKIADANVTTAKIADANITYGKLSNSATEADNAAKRVAKAWVRFDGTTNVGGFCTIQDDFNVSTVADNGDGNYTINFSTEIGNSNYAIAGMAQPTSAVPNGIGISSATSPTSTALTVVTWSGTGPGINDARGVTVVVFAS